MPALAVGYKEAAIVNRTEMHKSDLCNSTDVEQEARDASQMEAFDYKFLAESIPEILWSAHADGTPHYHNPQWHDYTGLTRDETS